MSREDIIKRRLIFLITNDIKNAIQKAYKKWVGDGSKKFLNFRYLDREMFILVMAKKIIAYKIKSYNHRMVVSCNCKKINKRVVVDIEYAL